MSTLVAPDPSQNFNHILRLLNTNVDGKIKIMYALSKIGGVGRRYANIVCKKADVDLRKRWVSDGGSGRRERGRDVRRWLPTTNDGRTREREWERKESNAEGRRGKEA